MIRINRAPVLTLWAAVVAERLGFDRDEALTLGKAVAGLSAQAKGRRLGIFEPSPDSLEQKRREHGRDEVMIDFMQRHVPAIVTPDGIRATTHGKAISPQGVEKYVAGKFGAHLDEARAAMTNLLAAVRVLSVRGSEAVWRAPRKLTYRSRLLPRGAAMPSGNISTPANEFVVEYHGGNLDQIVAGVKADRAAVGFSGRGFPDAIFHTTRDGGFPWNSMQPQGGTTWSEAGSPHWRQPCFWCATVVFQAIRSRYLNTGARQGAVSMAPATPRQDI